MSEPPVLRVARLAHGEGLPLPAYKSAGAAGLDLIAALEEGRDLTLRQGDRALLETGLVLAIPDGFEGQIRPRSGLALNMGLTVLNTPGTIDADYRGEVKVLLINHGTDAVRIERGMRIAQLVLAPIARAAIEEVRVESLDATLRGAGGFGSTGH